MVVTLNYMCNLAMKEEIIDGFFIGPIHEIQKGKLTTL